MGQRHVGGELCYKEEELLKVTITAQFNLYESCIKNLFDYTLNWTWVVTIGSHFITSSYPIRLISITVYNSVTTN